MILKEKKNWDDMFVHLMSATFLGKYFEVIKEQNSLGMVVHAYNTSYLESTNCKDYSLMPAWAKS